MLDELADALRERDAAGLAQEAGGQAESGEPVRQRGGERGLARAVEALDRDQAPGRHGRERIYDGRLMEAATLPGTEQHPHARTVLGAALAAGGRPSHAYLFHGPPGTGKRAAARAFAAELLAEGEADEASARARALAGVHPDLTWVAPTGVHEMRVEDVAEPVVVAAARTPFESARRVFVLEQADTLHERAANRLLKTLEEPPSFVHLILVSDRLGEVLPTITSRCQLVRFDPLPSETVAARLQDEGVDAARATACARLALGDGSRAAMLASAEGAELRAEAEAFARAPLHGKAVERPWGALLKRARTQGAAAAAEAEASLAEELEFTAKKDQRRTTTDYAERAKRASAGPSPPRSTSSSSSPGCGTGTCRRSPPAPRTSCSTPTASPSCAPTRRAAAPARCARRSRRSRRRGAASCSTWARSSPARRSPTGSSAWSARTPSGSSRNVGPDMARGEGRQARTQESAVAALRRISEDDAWRSSRPP